MTLNTPATRPAIDLDRPARPDQAIALGGSRSRTSSSADAERITAIGAERVSVADLDVERFGSGPMVVLVHGSVVDARRTWRRQRALARHWALCIPNRPGFAASPPLARGDFELEAPLIADMLGDEAHLLGHSYGAVIAPLAAAARPRPFARSSCPSRGPYGSRLATRPSTR
jgi:pimeloyl-ACP methyl ester carboxylesterase